MIHHKDNDSDDNDDDSDNDQNNNLAINKPVDSRPGQY